MNSPRQVILLRQIRAVIEKNPLVYEILLNPSDHDDLVSTGLGTFNGQFRVDYVTLREHKSIPVGNFHPCIVNLQKLEDYDPVKPEAPAPVAEAPKAKPRHPDMVMA